MFIVIQHYKYVDGNDYQQHIKDSNIRLFDRICNIANIYAALKSSCSSMQRLSIFEARALMLEKFA